MGTALKIIQIAALVVETIIKIKKERKEKASLKTYSPEN